MSLPHQVGPAQQQSLPVTKVFYFDSFGNLRPPKELIKYLKGCDIYYNRERFQHRNPWNCGHLSLQFLIREASPPGKQQQ